MKRTETLKKNYEFKNVLTKGKGYYGKYVNAYIINDNSSINKIGIAVSKKIAIAVKRNKIKRWIREAYNLYESNLYSNYKIVFILKKDVQVNEINYEKIKTDLNEIFVKAGII